MSSTEITRHAQGVTAAAKPATRPEANASGTQGATAHSAPDRAALIDATAAHNEEIAKATGTLRQPAAANVSGGPSALVAVRARASAGPAVALGFAAIRANDLPALRAWIAAHGDVDACDPSGMRLIQLAAVRGNVDALRALLDAHARVDLPHAKSGAQALHMAASGGSREAVQLLIGAGAAREAIWPMNGHTPLVEALFKNNVDAALALLDASADPTRTSIRGVGTMDFAMRNPTLNRPVIERLDALFATRSDAVKRKDAEGNVVLIGGRPVHDVPPTVKASAVQVIFDAVAAGDAQLRPALRQDKPFLDLLAAADRGDLDAVRKAIDAEPTMLEQRGGPLGTTPLILATVNGRIDVVRLLLEHGANPNLTEVHPMGVHALFKAAIFGHTEIANLLVKAGAHLDDQGLANGMTPLHDAVLQGRAELVRVLLAANARADIEDYTGATAIQFARERGSDAVRAVFQEYFPMRGASTAV